MVLRKLARVVLPLFAACIVIAGLCINASISSDTTPRAIGGVLSLAEWRGTRAFAIRGEWAFYWDKLLNGTQIKAGLEKAVLVEAPSEWNYYDTPLGRLPGKGQATYHVQITGVRAGTQYGIRIQNMASAYRLYADDILLAQNGAFGDTERAHASAYRPQLAVFTPTSDSVELILQVGNNAYALGGMWEPVIFGTAGQVTAYNSLLSDIGVASYTSIFVLCLFFIIFYAARRQDRDVLILACLGAVMLLRLTVNGDMAITYLLPGMPISGFGWIDYLTLIWAQFLLLYFVYCAYGGLVRKWQLITLVSYCGLVTVCVLVLPFAVITAAYTVLNVILMLVILLVTVQLGRAAWRGLSGASSLLGALGLILLFNLYGMAASDWSSGYYLLIGSSLEYIVLFFVQCIIVARRYHRAQMLEVSFLKSQIRPHFIHNALTTIISVSRKDAERARELLTEFSSYLRGFYDYDADELITLEQELELIRAYAALEQARFGNRVTVDYQIDDDGVLLPPLILQPLVENAFVHGLREKDGGGKVLVYARKTAGGKIVLGVRDDGVGMKASGGTAQRRGVGIENINRRLSRLYRTSLKVDVPDGGGCDIRMEIPRKGAADARIPR